MPTISEFYGIVIRMYWNDHSPPHFHAIYGDDEALIAVDEPKLIRGRLPKTAMSLVLEWAALHKDELEKDWELCRSRQMPAKIEPLD